MCVLARQCPSAPSRAHPPRGSRWHSLRTAQRRRPLPWVCSVRSCRPVGVSPRPSLSSSRPAGDRPPRVECGPSSACGREANLGGTPVSRCGRLSSPGLSDGEEHSDFGATLRSTLVPTPPLVTNCRQVFRAKVWLPLKARKVIVGPISNFLTWPVSGHPHGRCLCEAVCSHSACRRLSPGARPWESWAAAPSGHRLRLCVATLGAPPLGQGARGPAPAWPVPTGPRASWPAAGAGAHP